MAFDKELVCLHHELGGPAGVAQVCVSLLFLLGPVNQGEHTLLLQTHGSTRDASYSMG